MTDLAGLGRLPSKPDARNAAFRMAPQPTDRTFRNWLAPGAPFDQGRTSECVAYSGCHFLMAHPVVNKPLEMHTLYLECQRNDGWPGESPEYDGTSVHALFKVLRLKGYITSYRWGITAREVVQHLLTVGPVVMGTDWHEDMFMADRYGYIAPTGPVAGGHAYLLVCANTRRVNPDGTIGAVRVLNSWGSGWCDKGRAWLAMHHLDALIRSDGEACAAVEQKLVGEWFAVGAEIVDKPAERVAAGQLRHAAYHLRTYHGIKPDKHGTMRLNLARIPDAPD